jgi:hypothetical protein
VVTSCATGSVRPWRSGQSSKPFNGVYERVYERGVVSDHSAPSFTNNFVNCLYGVLDPKTGGLIYINA